MFTWTALCAAALMTTLCVTLALRLARRRAAGSPELFRPAAAQ